MCLVQSLFLDSTMSYSNVRETMQKTFPASEGGSHRIDIITNICNFMHKSDVLRINVRLHTYANGNDTTSDLVMYVSKDMQTATQKVWLFG